MALGGFSECSGLEMSLDVEEYQEGGNNGRVHKFPTRVTWSNIRLRRGVSISDDLWNWHYAFVEGKGQRRDGIITLQNDMHIPFKVWHFYGGLPVRWIGPSLDAAQSQIAIEELEIVHQGIRLTRPAPHLTVSPGCHSSSLCDGGEPMDVHIGEMNSTVRTTDAQALLTPRILNQIVRIVLAQLREELEHEQRMAQERRLWPSLTESEAPYGGRR